jgi:hypothetical protein
MRITLWIARTHAIQHLPVLLYFDYRMTPSLFAIFAVNVNVTPYQNDRYI